MIKVFIDGRNGTTGLRIDERLALRDDIEILSLPEDKRKDEYYRAQMLNTADVVFLCLPDDAARQAVSMISSPTVKVIDTSTAHRTAEGWAYGFPELGPEFEQAIVNSKRIAVPGCHASGFIALIHPLVKAGLISKDALLSCTSLTGYSGGGKKMIAEYNDPERSELLDFPRTYGLSQKHKHLKEMQAITGLNAPPVFMPIVGDFYSGMQVIVPLHRAEIDGDIDAIKEIYKKTYIGDLVYYDESDESGFTSCGLLAGKDGMVISVFGNEDRIILTARYDNLGKGASGAAVECLNLITNKPKKDSLIL